MLLALILPRSVLLIPFSGSRFFNGQYIHSIKLSMWLEHGRKVLGTPGRRGPSRRASGAVFVWFWFFCLKGGLVCWFCSLLECLTELSIGVLL